MADNRVFNVKDKLFSLFITLVVFSLAFSLNPIPASAMPTVSIPKITGTQGQTTVDIPINIDNAQGVAGFQFTISYDSSVLKATKVASGDLTSGWMISGNLNTPGQITIAGLSTSATPLGSGGGSLVVITFNVVAPKGAETSIKFLKCKLTDEDGNKIDALTVDGEYSGSSSANKHTLSLTKSGQGTVTSIPTGINCGSTCSAQFDYNTGVTLIATPASGYSFQGWGGDCSVCGTGTSCPILIVSDTNCTANFVPSTSSQYTFTSGNDINFIHDTTLHAIGAGAGDDVYILDPNYLTSGQHIIIIDHYGNNVIRLATGLQMNEIKVSKNSIEFVLNNGAAVEILTANQFRFDIGGDELSGEGSIQQNFYDFVTNSLGLSGLPTSYSDIRTISGNIQVTDNGLQITQ